MEDVMLDLETLGNGPRAAIVAIGAVEFDLAQGEIGRRFYQPVTLESALSLGGEINASTVVWWMQQSDAARAVFSEPGVPLSKALLSFAAWMPDNARVWGNGATFDNVILTSAYAAAGVARPWTYKGDRCYRTAMALYGPVTLPGVGIHHHAADDAEYQARCLLAVLFQKHAG